MKSTFQLHHVTLLPQDHGCQLKDGKIEVQWIDQPFNPSSSNEIKLHLVLQFQIMGGRGGLNKRESPTDNLNINKWWVQIKWGSENVP